MGTIIESVAVSNSIFNIGVLKLIHRAAKKCLRKNNTNIRDIGMLINTGVYNEDHMGEPALAALVQNKLQLKNNTQNISPGLFSFDLHNGGGGLLSAIQIIDGFIQSGEIKYGLVVSGDTKPVSGHSENYNYTTGAGAILLTNSKNPKGFVSFNTQTFPEFETDFESYIHWDTGKFGFTIKEHSNFLKNCVSCAAVSIKYFFEKEKLDWTDIDLLVTSQSPKGFEKELQKELDFKSHEIQTNKNHEHYTSGVIFSLNKVFQKNKFKASKHILFLTVGSGITVSLSLYKN